MPPNTIVSSRRSPASCHRSRPKDPNTSTISTRFAWSSAMPCSAILPSEKLEARSIILTRCICNPCIPRWATRQEISRMRSARRKKCFRCLCIPNCAKSRSREWSRQSPIFLNVEFSKIRSSFSQVEKSQQKNPESIHEMPIEGSNFGGHRKRKLCLFKFVEEDKKQRPDSTEEMQTVGSSEYIEETAGRIAGHENALSNELPPRDELADQKKSAEPCRCGPQFTEAGQIEPRKRMPRPL